VIALQLIVLAMGLIALYGMRELKTTGSSVKLWFVIGLHIALAPLGIFSIGLGPIFSTGIMIAYAAFRARHLGVPTIDRWGLLAETIGFSIPFAFVLWAA
jgi:hypothetical protein